MGSTWAVDTRAEAVRAQRYCISRLTPHLPSVLALHNLTNSGHACWARQRESGTNRFILYVNQFRKLNGPVSAVKCCTLSEQSAVISDSVAPRSSENVQCQS